MKHTFFAAAIFAFASTTAGAAVTTTLQKEVMNEKEFADFGEALQTCSPSKLLSAIARQAAQQNILKSIQADDNQKLSAKLKKFKTELVFKNNPQEFADWESNGEYSPDQYWNNKGEIIQYTFGSGPIREDLRIAVTQSTSINNIILTTNNQYGMYLAITFTEGFDYKKLQAQLNQAGYKVKIGNIKFECQKK